MSTLVDRPSGRADFNNQRPHSSLVQQTPAEFYAGTRDNADRIEAPKRVA